MRFSTAALRSGEYPKSSSYPAHLRNRGKIEQRTTTLTQGDMPPTLGHHQLSGITRKNAGITDHFKLM